MINKSFEIKISINCNIEELNRDTIRKDLEVYANFDELQSDLRTWILLEREKRLFQLLLEDQETLSNIMQSHSICEAIEAAGQLEKGCVDSSELLYKLSKRLKLESDVRHFEKAYVKGLMSENIEHIIERIKPEITNIEVCESEL